MKKIACAFVVALGLFACKKEVKTDTQAFDKSKFDTTVAEWGCKPCTDLASCEALASNATPSDKDKGVLGTVATPVACPKEIDATKPENATKCTADGKSTDVLRGDNCVNTYKSYVEYLKTSAAAAPAPAATTPAPAATTAPATPAPTAPAKK